MMVEAFVHQPFFLLVNRHFTDGHGNMRVHFVIDGTLARIQHADGLHVFLIEGKVEDIDVFLHPRFMDRLGDDDDIPLEQPAQHDLTDGLAVFVSDVPQKLRMEDIVVPFSKGRPCFLLDAQFFHEAFFSPFLVPYVGFNLIDSRRDGIHVGQVCQPFVPETGNADGPDTAFLIEPFHGPPGPIVIAIGLVDQIEIQIIQA